MKRLIREEGKQVGTLYHYTSIRNLFKILESNSLYSSIYNISFTRNQNFHSLNRDTGAALECRLEIDGDSLSNNYKIEPFHDQKFFKKEMPDEANNPQILESEEVVSKKTISPIIPYIKKLLYIKMMITSINK